MCCVVYDVQYIHVSISLYFLINLCIIFMIEESNVLLTKVHMDD